MVNWEKIREEFPAMKEWVYLNAAGGSPLSKRSAEAGRRFYDEMLAAGDIPWEEWLNRKEEARNTVAVFLGGSSEGLAFTLNTSHGMNLVADMLADRGEVLTMEDEFPSTTIPWLHRNIPVTFLKSDNGEYSHDMISEEIDSDTGILVTSHVQYRTGFRHDLESLGRICRERGIIFVVNATQSIGAMNIDVEKSNIDFLVFLGMKWPAAGYGIGGIYINPDRLKEIRLPVMGWRSVRDFMMMDNTTAIPSGKASDLEMGCPHFPNIFALGESIKFIAEIGIQAIQDRILELGKILENRLHENQFRISSPLSREHRSGITIIPLDNPEVVVEKLKEKKIIVSARGGGLRVSLHFYNNEEDIDALVKALEKIYNISQK